MSVTMSGISLLNVTVQSSLCSRTITPMKNYANYRAPVSRPCFSLISSPSTRICLWKRRRRARKHARGRRFRRKRPRKGSFVTRHVLDIAIDLVPIHISHIPVSRRDQITGEQREAKLAYFKHARSRSIALSKISISLPGRERESARASKRERKPARKANDDCRCRAAIDNAVAIVAYSAECEKKHVYHPWTRLARDCSPARWGKRRNVTARDDGAVTSSWWKKDDVTAVIRSNIISAGSYPAPWETTIFPQRWLFMRRVAHTRAHRVKRYIDRRFR